MKTGGFELRLAAAGAALALVACGGSTPSVAPAPSSASPTASAVPPAPVAAAPANVAVDLASVVTDPGWVPASVNLVDGKLMLTSNPGSGGFSAWVVLPKATAQPGSGRILVTIKVTHGAIGLNGTALGDSTKQLTPLAVVNAGPEETAASVTVKDFSTQMTLLFSNAATTGVSKAEISKIEVVRP